MEAEQLEEARGGLRLCNGRCKFRDILTIEGDL